jgi:N4-gp56 family major capsid protein
MSEVTLASTLEKQKWITDYFKEYVRESGFAGYMGRGPTSIIIGKYELQEEAGKTINIPLIVRLTGDGVTGSTVLDGNEEDLGNYNCAISVDWRRNGVRVPKSTQYKTEINLLNAARPLLRQWEAEKLRDDIIKAMLSLTQAADASNVLLSASDATARNLFNANNSDRQLWGKLKSNYSATWATAIGNSTPRTTNAPRRACRWPSVSPRRRVRIFGRSSRRSARNISWRSTAPGPSAT